VGEGCFRGVDHGRDGEEGGRQRTQGVSEEHIQRAPNQGVSKFTKTS